MIRHFDMVAFAISASALLKHARARARAARRVPALQDMLTLPAYSAKLLPLLMIRAHCL